MIKKKTLLTRIEALEKKLIDVQKSSMEAMVWLTSNPSKVKVYTECRAKTSPTSCYNIASCSDWGSFFDTSISNDWAENIISVQYYDKLRTQVIERVILSRSIEYNIDIVSTDYDFKTGQLSIKFTSRHVRDSESLLYHYSCNVYDIHSRLNPALYYFNDEGKWIKLPYMIRTGATDSEYIFI